MRKGIAVVLMSCILTGSAFVSDTISTSKPPPFLEYVGRNGISDTAIRENPGLDAVISTVSNPAALSSASLPALGPVYIEEASGIHLRTSRHGTCGLIYLPGTTSPTNVYGEVLNKLSGIYWQPNYTQSPVKACEFGAVGDASYNYATGEVTGTDNTPMIQAALNYAMQNGLAAVCLDDGKYKTTDTLQQGWGETFRSLSFVSCNQGRAAFYELQGVQIIPTKIDRCALNIQGGRMVGVRGISFVGRNNVYIDKVINSGAAFPTTEAGWFDPALVPSGNNPGGLKNHSPYAAVCIDAYAGAAPADAYPGQNNIPSWTGLAGQYNRKLTSDVEITNVQCIGFALCVNSKPAGDGNGDFVKVDKLDCQYSTYCISIGNTQARSTSIKNITANRVYAVLTNNRFGLGLGVLDGPIENISLGESYQFFNLGALSYFGNTTVRNIYGEAFVRVGSFSNGASFTSSLTLDGCDLSLYQQLTQVIPAALIEAASTGGAIPITFRSCMLANGGQRIDTLIHGSAAVVIDGGAFKGGASLGSVFGTSPVQQALNYTGSVLVGSAMTFPLSPGYSPFSPLKWLNPTVAAFMTNPNSSDGQQYMGTDASFMFGRRARGQFTQATTSFVDLFNNRRWQFALGPTGSLIQLSNTTAGDVTVVATYTGCDSMRFTYAARQQSPQNQSSNIATGDILYHENTGTIFVITTIDAPDRRGNYPITARQMNNMNINPNKYACASNNISDPTVGGHTFLIHTGVMNVPAMPFFGSFTLGSTNVTNVSRGDGYAGDLSAYVNSGDKILGYPKGQDSYFGWPYPAGASIAAVIDGSPGGLTLSAPATLSGRFPILPLPVVGGPQ